MPIEGCAKVIADRPHRPSQAITLARDLSLFGDMSHQIATTVGELAPRWIRAAKCSIDKHNSGTAHL